MRRLLGLLVFFSLLLKAPLLLAANVSNAKPIKVKGPTATSQSSLAASMNIDPNVLNLALNAYKCAVSTGVSKQKYLTIIDYSRPATKNRLWVVDTSKNQVVFNTLVAHGQGSGGTISQHFSNRPNSHASSIGLFVTGNMYQGGNGPSLKLFGLEKGFNDKAASRNIVVHGAPYVNHQFAKSGRLGRSWGCPAVPQHLAGPLMKTIQKGSVVFSYYPDTNWFKKSKYLNCRADSLKTA